MSRGFTRINDQELFYLRSVLKYLQEFKGLIPDDLGLSLGNLVLAEDVDWLDCWIDHEDRLRASERIDRGVERT